MRINRTAVSFLKDFLYFETEVLNSYILRVENDVQVGIVNYKEKIKIVHVEEFIENNQIQSAVIQDCEGLDSETYSFEYIFEKYFPLLQRSGALITLCSFFECTLTQFVEIFQKEFALPKFKVNGKIGTIESVNNYLNTIAKFNFTESTLNILSEIKQIQKIRNRFVHHNGVVNKESQSYIFNNKFLSGNNEIIIEIGFLQYVLDCYQMYVKKILDNLVK